MAMDNGKLPTPVQERQVLAPRDYYDEPWLTPADFVRTGLMVAGGVALGLLAARLLRD